MTRAVVVVMDYYCPIQATDRRQPRLLVLALESRKTQRHTHMRAVQHPRRVSDKPRKHLQAISAADQDRDQVRLWALGGHPKSQGARRDGAGGESPARSGSQ
jgi:hypothetical protein